MLGFARRGFGLGGKRKGGVVEAGNTKNEVVWVTYAHRRILGNNRRNNDWLPMRQTPYYPKG